MHSPERTLSLTTTSLSLYPLLPSPSYIPSYLSQSQAATLGTDTGVPRRHPSLSSCCVPSPGMSVLAQGWRGQGEKQLLGLCESSLNPSPLHQRRQLLYQGLVFNQGFTITSLWICFFFPPPLPETPPDVWCIFLGYALLFLGCFVVIVACSHWRVPLPLVNGPLTSSLHAGVGPGNC